MPVRSLHLLLHGLIDYAGLYPPAKLGMAAAVDNYATYLHSREAWMLGRFICPVSRLEEFRREARELLPKTDPAQSPSNDATTAQVADTDMNPWDAPWGISAIIDGDLEENLDSIFAFNHEHQQPKNGLANIDAIELKATSPSYIDEALDAIPEELYPFFEIPIGPTTSDMRGFIAALAGADAAAKIRTGGITPEAFPSSEAVAEFLVAAAAADVTFKATAGLHHPIRSEHGLTYEPACPRGIMHGFLNMFIAAAAAKCMNAGASALTELLNERNASALRFTDDGIEWRGSRLGVGDIAAAREGFALSFGSCSFEEPIEDVRNLGLLRR